MFDVSFAGYSCIEGWSEYSEQKDIMKRRLRPCTCIDCTTMGVNTRLTQSASFADECGRGGKENGVEGIGVICQSTV